MSQQTIVKAYGNYINGEWVGKDLPTRDVVNPVTNEVIGYGLPNSRFLEKIAPFVDRIKSQSKRDEDADLSYLYEKFVGMGFQLSPLDVLRKRLEMGNVRCGPLVARDVVNIAENADLVEQFGFGIDAVYQNYFNNPKSPFYFRSGNTYPTLEVVSRAIRDAGGLCVMAHVFKLPEPSAMALLEYCVARKLIDGVEVYHPVHNETQEAYLLEFCAKHDLYVSGGTDNHASWETLGIDKEVSILQKLLS